MIPEVKKTTTLRLTQPLSNELEQLRQLTYGLCARENVLESACDAAPLNFVGALIYAHYAEELKELYGKGIRFTPHPDFAQPYQIVDGITICRLSLESGTWIPTDNIGKRVLIKHICGERIGVILGSENNPDPLAGLLLRPHSKYPNFSHMRAIRLWNDVPCSENILPYALSTTTLEQRSWMFDFHNLLNIERSMAVIVRLRYVQTVRAKAAEVGVCVRISEIMQQLFELEGIDADMQHFHMTQWD